MANLNRANLITESATLFPDNNTQEISPADLRSWLADGTASFVTQKDKSTLENAIFEAKGTTLASAATVDLNTATGNYLQISGTATINSFGTCPAGARFILMFQGIATLTYNATSLIIPGLANKTTAAGDCCMIVSEGSGNWRIVGYFAISGGGGGGSVTAVTGTAPIASTGGTAPDISIPQANGLTDGYLSSTDWNTFDGKGTGTITALTGDVTASGTGSVTATIANGAVDIAMLSATGTPSATTFLRGDNTWDTPAGSGVPGGSDTEVQYNNAGSFGGIPELTYQGGFVRILSPKIGTSNTNGHLHIHNSNSAPTGITNYLTTWWEKATRVLGFRSELDTHETYIALTAPTADRTITLPDASGNVVIDSTVPSFSNGVSAGEIRFLEPSGDGTNYVALKSQATTADYSITLPPAAPSGAQYLQSTGVGGVLQWTSGTTTGVSSVGTINSVTKNPNGVNISGSNIIMQTADATNNGLVSIGTQTFAGAKTFQGGISLTTGGTFSSAVAATFSASAASAASVTINASAGSQTNAALSVGAATTAAFIELSNSSYSAAPNITTRSVGTKVIIAKTQNGLGTDYAIGYNYTSSEMWLSAFSTAGNVSFYGGQTRLGRFTANGLTLDAAGSTTTANANLIINGGPSTIGWMSFGNNGIAAPTITTERSAGTKIVLREAFSGGAGTDYAIGYNTADVWISVFNNTATISMYAGATRLAFFGGGAGVGLTFGDAQNIVFNTTTGTKIATATSQKLAFWNKTPIVQPTTGITGATRIGGGGTTVTTTDTYGGYTLAQIAAALVNTGILA
jgi:hypothetical protein